MSDEAKQASGGAQLTDEHHSWMENFFGVSTRPKPEAAPGGASGAAPGGSSPPKKEERSGGFFGALSDAASAVGNAASTVVHGAVDATEKVVSVATDVVSKVAETAIDVSAKVEQAVVDVAPLPDSVKGMAKTAIDFQKGVGEGAVEGVKGLVKGVAHLAGSVTKEAYDLATSEKAREEAGATVLHGAEAVGGFVKTAVTDPSKAGEQIKGAVKGAADKVLQVGKAVYHSYEEAEKAGHGAEWIGKGVGQVGVMVAGAVLTDGASLAGEGAAVAGEGVMLATEGAGVLTEGATLARGAAALEEGATLARGTQAVEEGATLARGAGVVEEGATAGRGASALEEGGAVVKQAKTVEQGATSTTRGVTAAEDEAAAAAKANQAQPMTRGASVAEEEGGAVAEKGAARSPAKRPAKVKAAAGESEAGAGTAETVEEELAEVEAEAEAGAADGGRGSGDSGSGGGGDDPPSSGGPPDEPPSSGGGSRPPPKAPEKWLKWPPPEEPPLAELPAEKVPDVWPDAPAKLKPEVAANWEKAGSAAKDTLEEAVEAEPELTASVAGATEETGGKMIGLKYRVKSAESLTQKVASDMAEFGLDADEAAGGISDAVRYTSSFPPDKLAEGALSTLDRLEAEGNQIAQIKNTWLDPSKSYKGINVQMIGADGQPFELQFHTPESFWAKDEGTHAIFEQMRKLDPASPEWAKLNEQQMEIARSLEVPKGIDKIKPFKKKL